MQDWPTLCKLRAGSYVDFLKMGSIKSRTPSTVWQIAFLKQVQKESSGSHFFGHAVSQPFDESISERLKTTIRPNVLHRWSCFPPERE